MKFRYHADYVSHIVAHALLRQSVSAIAGGTPDCVIIKRAQNGKPELLQDSVAIPSRFNLSHTEGMVVVALARDVEVGVDVERLNRKFAPEIVEYLCSAEEAQEISHLPTQHRSVAYIKLWTLKEALVKASGQGLSTKISEICCALNSPRLLRSGPLPDGPAAWSVWHGHLTGGFAWSVAAHTPQAELTVIEAS
jgi:4'-phosphopantetheinyl transferase